MKHTFVLCCCLAVGFTAMAQQEDSIRRTTIEEVQIQAKKAEGVSRISGAVGGLNIGQDELFRAACCNLGESFVTNPSVDVNYNDAAVGARQIKLLGLSGEYVQVLGEGLPASTGATMPYTLGYVPGAWMKSLSVSKGAASELSHLPIIVDPSHGTGRWPESRGQRDGHHPPEPSPEHPAAGAL